MFTKLLFSDFTKYTVKDCLCTYLWLFKKCNKNVCDSKIKNIFTLFKSVAPNQLFGLE